MGTVEYCVASIVRDRRLEASGSAFQPPISKSTLRDADLFPPNSHVVFRSSDSLKSNSFDCTECALVRLNFSTLYKAGRSANSELSSKTGNKKQKERGRACVIPKIAQVIQETGGREGRGERRRKGEEERESCSKHAAKEKMRENERIEEQDKAASKYKV